MYATGNPQTKKALRELIASGNPPTVFSPGPWPAPQNGRAAIEGPHSPKPHRWYASVMVEEGRIVKVLG